MKKRTGHPTREILRLAQASPGGLIRWHEARDVYLQESEAARRDEKTAMRKGGRNGNRNYHMNLQRILKGSFTKVQGTDGYWVLKHSIVGDREGDVLDVDLLEYHEWLEEQALSATA